MMTSSKSAMRLGSRTMSRAYIHPTTTTATTTAVPKIAIRQQSTFSSALASFRAKPKKDLALGLAGGFLIAGLHSATGSQSEFYDYRFRTNKTCDDVAEFYGAEDFMELYSVLPLMQELMMRGGEFNEEGDVITAGLPFGTMKVSMVFSEEEKDGEMEWFNKRERFKNTLFGYTIWDMVTNFGVRKLEDGTVECYHFGEYFHGPMPIIGQAVFIMFSFHARWVAWATEHHLNYYAFADDEDEEAEKDEELSRKNHPYFLVKHFFLGDLKGTIFGVKHEEEDTLHENSPSFLVKRKSTVTSYEEDDHKLPIQRAATLMKIHHDIETDKANIKRTLSLAKEFDADAGTDETTHQVVLARKYTLKPEDTDEDAKKIGAYSAATDAAKAHHLARKETLQKQKTVAAATATVPVESAINTGRTETIKNNFRDHGAIQYNR